MNERIKELRKKLDLTQAEFGEQIKLTPSAILKIEKGTNSVTERTLSAICRVFKVRRPWLETGEEPMLIQPNEDVAALAANVVMGDNETAKSFLKIIATLEVEELALLEKIARKLAKEFPAED